MSLQHLKQTALSLGIGLLLGAWSNGCASPPAPASVPQKIAGGSTRGANAERLEAIMKEVDRVESFQPFVDHLADDVVFRATIPDGTPASGEHRGKEAVTEYFMKTLPAFAVFEQKVPMEFVDDGDRVIILGDDAYKMIKTGQTFRSPYAMVVRFERDRIKSILIIQDLSGMAAAYR